MWQEINDQNLWDSFVISQEHAVFLQSFTFSKFHESLGNKVWRLGLMEGGNLSGVCSVLRLETKFNTYLYIPAGPIVNNQEELLGLLEKLKQLANEQKASFVRFDPRQYTQLERSKFEELGLKRVSNFTQPESSMLLSLDKSLEEIRSGLSDSTRYNINATNRKGVRIRIGNLEEISLFTKLLAQTASRHKFTLYGQKDYYEKQFLSFSRVGQAKLFLAQEPEELGEEVIAASIVLYYGDTVTYLHAASSLKWPKLRAPYLIQWKIIEDAKNSGFAWYDFWGVAKDDKPDDPWAGVTAFKKSFGGERIAYQSPYDLVTKKRYNLDRFLENIRKPLRKLLR